jgi:hypothetical protein
MPISINIKLDKADEVDRYLKERPRAIRKSIFNAIKKTVLSVQGESRRRSPVDTGRLRASIETKQYESFLEGQVYTGVRYAIAVHENERARHRVGEAKFLTNAVNHLERKINKFFKEAITESVKK